MTLEQNVKQRKLEAVRATLAGDDGIRQVLDHHAQLANASAEERQLSKDMAREHWERFYKRNKMAFFKPKYHLRTAFPEMMPEAVRENPTTWIPPLVRRYVDCSEYSFPLDSPPPGSIRDGKVHFLELGCGVGNAAFPLLRANPDLFGWCCDFSKTSIHLLKSCEEYDPERMYAFQADITDMEQFRPHVPTDCRMRYITAVWVLSAIDPRELGAVLRHMYSMMEPGGYLFLRDYGRGDLSQLRLKSNSCKLDDDYYVVGDGTLRHFFSEEECRQVFEAAGFHTVEISLEKRLIKNHKEDIEMHRLWIQGKFQRPFESS